jgi:receptor-type tyrosine-protein phosphatase gamma
VTAIPLNTVLSEAGSNVTLACPGVTELSLVHMLEWRSQVKLVEYMGESTTVWEHRHRITLLPDTFALHFHPVTAEDSAEYSCLVNNRPKPEAIVRLIVQGKTGHSSYNVTCFIMSLLLLNIVFVLGPKVCNRNEEREPFSTQIISNCV